MTGLKALELLLEGKVHRIRRKGDDDMFILLDEEGQLSLSNGYDFYIRQCTMIRASTHQEIALLCNRTGLVPTPYAKGISLVRENRILAVVAYDRWTENCVEMHVWAHFLIPGFVKAAFEYPSKQFPLQC